MSVHEVMHARIAEKAMRTPKEAYRVLMERYDVAISVNEEFTRSPSLEKALLGGFRNIAEDHNARESDQELLDSWKYASLYARKVIGERWNEFEEAVEQLPTEECRSSLDSLMSYCKMAGASWNGGERHIATDAGLAATYAIEVAKQPWKDGHAALTSIKGNHEVSGRYGLFVEEYSQNLDVSASALCR